MTEQNREMRFSPQGRPEVVVKTGKELAESGIFVFPAAVATALGEDHAKQYVTLMAEKRG